MSEVNLNLVTSTPILKSTKGRLILKELFVTNLPKDITLIKQDEVNKIRPEKIQSKNIEKSCKKVESPAVHKDVKKFLEAHRKEESSFVYTPPRSLTPATKRLVEEYYLRSTVKKIKIHEKRVIRL